MNHLKLFLFFIITTTGLSFLLPSKKNKHIFITKLCLIIVMTLLEVGRMVYYYHWLHHPSNFYIFSWWFVISFHVCALMTWVTIFTLTFSLFINKNNKTLIVFKNILFGASLIGAALSFVFPDHIRPYLPIWHFIHAQSLLQHILLVFVPLYFIRIKELNIYIKNLWMPTIGFLGVMTIAYTAANISGFNFFIVTNDLVFTPHLPIEVAHPFQNVLIFIVGLILAFILYIITKLLTKPNDDNINCNTKFNLIILIPYITGVIAFYLIFWLPSFLGADFTSNRRSQWVLNSYLSLVILIPFILQVIIIYLTSHMLRKNKD